MQRGGVDALAWTGMKAMLSLYAIPRRDRSHLRVLRLLRQSLHLRRSTGSVSRCTER
jgi:hypothetical protein